MMFSSILLPLALSLISVYHLCESRLTSAVSLEHLASQEEYNVKEMQKCLEVMKEKGENTTLIEKYIDQHTALFSAVNSTQQLIRHPVNVFHFLRNAILNWLEMQEDPESKKGTIKEYVDRINRYRTTFNYPDFPGVIFLGASMARMQDMYQIPIFDFIQGKLEKSHNSTRVFQSTRSLSSWECAFVAYASFEHKYHKTGLAWIEAAKELAESGDESLPKENLDQLYSLMKNEQDKNEQMTMEEEMGQLCQGSHLKPEAVDPSLRCRYLTRNDPYLFIGPMKLEEKSRDPPVVVFHDFLVKEEIEQFKILAEPKLQPSKILTGDGSEGEINFYRLSEQSWITHKDNPSFITKITQRIQDATGLNTDPKNPKSTAVEDYQVLNYGVSGVYMPHHDYMTGNGATEDNYYLKNMGDRLATFMIYLSDVDSGGATVYPQADAFVWPEAGSAVFWYNLYTSGKTDYKSQHAGCPVVHGSKWISNKWIHIFAQSHLQCGLAEKERFTLL